jgi:hypothetical protein
MRLRLFPPRQSARVGLRDDRRAKLVHLCNLVASQLSIVEYVRAQETRCLGNSQSQSVTVIVILIHTRGVVHRAGIGF